LHYQEIAELSYSSSTLDLLPIILRSYPRSQGRFNSTCTFVSESRSHRGGCRWKRPMQSKLRTARRSPPSPSGAGHAERARCSCRGAQDSSGSPVCEAVTIKPTGLYDAGRPRRAIFAKLLECLVGVAGFEPATPSSRTRCSTRLSHTPINWCRAYSQRRARLQQRLGAILSNYRER
jgi:hypothetical protein